MNKIVSSSSTLLEQQAVLLLNELCTIVNEKWPVMNSNGHGCLKSILDSYATLFGDNDSENEENGETVGENEQTSDRKKSRLNHKTLPVINECNEKFEKLREIVNNFSVFANRLLAIKTNLFNMLGMNLDVFSGFKTGDLDLENFKNDLVMLCESYTKESKLKSVLFEKSLFESRFAHETQVTLVSLWIHQPCLNEQHLFKFVSFVKFYFLNKNK
jgi:hypothetical protein